MQQGEDVLSSACTMYLWGCMLYDNFSLGNWTRSRPLMVQKVLWTPFNISTEREICLFWRTYVWIHTRIKFPWVFKLTFWICDEYFKTHKIKWNNWQLNWKLLSRTNKTLHISRFFSFSPFWPHISRGTYYIKYKKIQLVSTVLNLPLVFEQYTYNDSAGNKKREGLEE